jgi:hypothetical protein
MEIHFTPFFSSFLHVIREVNTRASNVEFPGNTASLSWSPAIERAWCTLFIMIQRGMAGKTLIPSPPPSPKASPRPASASPSRMGRTRYASADRARLSPLVSTHVPIAPVASPHPPLTDATFDSFIYDFASPSSTASSRAPSPPPPLPPDLLLSPPMPVGAIQATTEEKTTAVPSVSRGRTMEGSRTRAPPPLPTSTPPPHASGIVHPTIPVVTAAASSVVDTASVNSAAAPAPSPPAAESLPTSAAASKLCNDASLPSSQEVTAAPAIAPSTVLASEQPTSYVGNVPESHPNSVGSASVSVNPRAPRMSLASTHPASSVLQPQQGAAAIFHAPALQTHADKVPGCVSGKPSSDAFNTENVQSPRSTIPGTTHVNGSSEDSPALHQLNDLLSLSDPSFSLDVHTLPIPASVFCLPPPSEGKPESGSAPSAVPSKDSLSPTLHPEKYSVKRKLELSSPALSAVHVTPNSAGKVPLAVDDGGLALNKGVYMGAGVPEAGAISPIVVGVSAALFGIAIGAAAVVFMKAHSRR